MEKVASKGKGGFAPVALLGLVVAKWYGIAIIAIITMNGENMREKMLNVLKKVAGGFIKGKAIGKNKKLKLADAIIKKIITPR